MNVVTAFLEVISLRIAKIHLTTYLLQLIPCFKTEICCILTQFPEVSLGKGCHCQLMASIAKVSRVNPSASSLPASKHQTLVELSL